MTERYRVAVDPFAENNPHAFAIRMVGRGHDVLEVGCATGHVTEHLVAAGNRVTGVEVDAAAAEVARPLLRALHVVDLDRTSLSTVEQQDFDVLVLGDVLEHFTDPRPVIADLLTLLRPGGRVVISVPHVAHVDVRLMLLEGTWEYQDDGLLDRSHVRWFTRQGVAELLADVGLVATAVERVRVGVGGSNVPCHPEVHGAEVLEFIRADPEWDTYQFVLTAERAAGQPDALAGSRPTWAPAGELAAHAARLEEANRALQAQLDAWQRSKAAKLTTLAHRALAPFRRAR
jgi:SAM-dependent methyltransferase